MGKQPPKKPVKKESKPPAKEKPPFSSDQMQRYFNEPEYRQQMYKRSTNFLRSYWWILLGTLVLIIVPLIIYVNYVVSGLPSLEQLENPKPELATKVYAVDGEVLDQFYFKNRTYVALDKIPKAVIEALISTEDKDFYKHWGVSPFRFIKAMVKNVLAFRLREGASTITQQLAKNLYNLKQGKESAFDKMTRKLREFITSVQIERTYTKKEILEMYLNWIYLGHSAYGIAAASSIYFDKPVDQLTLSEATMLVGMANGANYFDPIRNPQRAYRRRAIVLSQMVKDRKLKKEEADATGKDSLRFMVTGARTATGLAPHFVEYIRQQLLQMSEKYSFDIFKDGLSVYTTLDSRMQTHANKAVEEHLAEQQAAFDETWDWSKATDLLPQLIDKSIQEYPAYLKAMTVLQRDSISRSLRVNQAFIDSVKRQGQQIEIGLIVVDPHTGGIRAMVGGADYKIFKYGLNHTTQIRRQPGSAFKPFVYTVAIDNGWTPASEILNQPVTLNMEDGTRWTPGNSDGTIGGRYTLREGLRESINLVAVRLIMDIGSIQQVSNYAHRMGITTPVRPYESIALGTEPVIPLELTAAFGVYANEGVYVEPHSIIKIEDKDGNVIDETVPVRREVLSKQTAYIMTSMLEDVVRRGTGSRVGHFFRYPAGGKTGTTQDFADAWFVGFTRHLAAGVWIGFDDQRIRFTDWDGQGGRAAAPLWGRYMSYVYGDPSIGLKPEYFDRPDGIVMDSICVETKKAATQFCPRKFGEIFNIKNQPPTCTKHTAIGKEGEQNPNKIQF